LSSYTIVLLLISYLQVQGHLPNLQDPGWISRSGVKASHLWARPHTHHPTTPDSARGRGGKQSPTQALDLSKRFCWDTTFAPSVPPRVVWKQTSLTLADAILGFFESYAALDLERNIISIADGGLIERTSVYEPGASTRSPLDPNRDERRHHPDKWKIQL
jgi:hypothetical protein